MRSFSFLLRFLFILRDPLDIRTDGHARCIVGLGDLLSECCLIP